MAELVEPHEGRLARRKLREQPHDVVAKVQHAEAQQQPRSGAGDTEKKTLETKTCRHLSRLSAQRTEQTDLSGLAHDGDQQRARHRKRRDDDDEHEQEEHHVSLELEDEEKILVDIDPRPGVQMRLGRKHADDSADQNALSYRKDEFMEKELPFFFRNLVLLQIDLEELEPLLKKYTKKHFPHTKENKL